MIAAVLASGAAFYLSLAFIGIWPLAWLAPIPVLLAAFRLPARKAAAAAFAAYLLGGLNLLTYFIELMPPGVIAVVLFVPSAVFALCVLCARRAVNRLPAPLAALALPAAWTTWNGCRR